jgi:Ca2+-binding RTX toxin-like protein
MAVINGSNNSETINGTAGDDEIDGRGGDDTLRGRGGDDELFGNRGDDKLQGGGGDDKLYAMYSQQGQGNDRLTGGRGDDTFFFLEGFGGAEGGISHHIITDFEAGKFNGDVINLGAFGFASFKELKQAAFDDGAGNVIIELDSGQTLTLLNISEADLHFRSDFIIDPGPIW